MDYLFSPELTEIIVLSLWVSGAGTVFASIIGIALGAIVALTEFRGKRVVFAFLTTWMALPAVVIGLLVYLLLKRNGPLGALGLLYSPGAMMMAQAILATPILTVLTASALQEKGRRIVDTSHSLGAGWIMTCMTVVREARFAVITAVLTGFSRVIGETGMTMMVGGNIKGFTRVMTTTIALETMKGNFEIGITLGIVLIIIALFINIAIQLMQRVQP